MSTPPLPPLKNHCQSVSPPLTSCRSRMRTLAFFCPPPPLISPPHPNPPLPASLVCPYPARPLRCFAARVFPVCVRGDVSNADRYRHPDRAKGVGVHEVPLSIKSRIDAKPANNRTEPMPAQQQLLLTHLLLLVWRRLEHKRRDPTRSAWAPNTTWQWVWPEGIQGSLLREKGAVSD